MKDNNNKRMVDIKILSIKIDGYETPEDRKLFHIYLENFLRKHTSGYDFLWIDRNIKPSNNQELNEIIELNERIWKLIEKNREKLLWK